MNGAALVSGYCKGGSAGARKALDAFWRGVSELGVLSPIHRSWYDHVIGNWDIDDSPASVWLDTLSQPGLALSDQSAQPLAAARPPHAACRLRGPAQGRGHAVLRLRHRRQHRQDQGLRAQGTDRRYAPGFGGAAERLPGRRHRRRGLLGRRLYGQSRDLPADLQLPVARRGDRAGQSADAEGDARRRRARS